MCYKIKIENITNTFNYGSLMMAIICIDKLYGKDIEFYVDCDGMKNLNRLKSEVKNSNIYSTPKSIKIKGLNRYIKYYEIFRDRNKYDAVIILGGDDISEYYGLRAAENELKKIKFYSKFTKCILLGQTIGPFTGKRIDMAKKILNNVKIYSRDDKCLEYLNSIGVSCEKSRDLAFNKLPNNGKNILNKYSLNNEKYITIVPSGLVQCYTTNREEYIKCQVEIIKNMLDLSEMRDYKILLLPHVLEPSHVDDRKIIEEIDTRLENEYKNKVIFIKDEMLASEARTILANGLFTITGRMHAAVSTFYSRKPAISLSYSVKYSGVIGSGLDMNELIIECANVELWESHRIVDLVLEKAKYLFSNYNHILVEIDKNVFITEEIVDSQMSNLMKYLGVKY